MESQNSAHASSQYHYYTSNRGLSILLHLTGILSFSLSFLFLINTDTFINEAYGWHWQYLTVLGLTLSQATFIFAFLADATLYSPFFTLKNKLALCSAPLELLISILYWGLSAINRNLVVPPGIYINPLFDIGLHGLPSIVLCLDFLFFSPPWNISAVQAAGLNTTITGAYWLWVEHCFSHNGFYPYPLFGLITTAQRAVLFGVATVLMTGITLLAQGLYGKTRGSQSIKKQKFI